MKKLLTIFIIYILCISSVSFAKSYETHVKKDIGNNFVIEQTKKVTYIKYKGDIIKILSNESTKMPFSWDDGCDSFATKLKNGAVGMDSQKVWDSLGKTGQMSCLQENYMKYISIDTTKSSRFFIFHQGGSEGVSSSLLDIKTFHMYLLDPLYSIEEIIPGKNGIFFRGNTGLGACQGNIYLLTNTNKYIKQFDICDITTGTDSASLESIELLRGGRIQLEYSITSSDALVRDYVKVITVKI